MERWVPLFPISASQHADQVDHLLYFLVIVCGFFALLIFVLIITFSVRYRRSRHPIPQPTKVSTGLELFWTAVPFLITLVMFIWGSQVYMDGETPPRGAQDMYVVGKQWMWKIQHPEGRREINELHVPENTAIKLTLTSQDVIHSFFVPAFRLKQDVVPGRYTTLWFHATKAGTYHLFCSQYCGTQHSGMIGWITVMEPRDYEAWMSGGAGNQPLAVTGQRLFSELGCVTCHRFDTQGRGPNLAGVFGKPVLLEDGRTVTADENYVRESILEPAAKIVRGFKPVMPTFQGQVSDEQLNALVDYVKSLAGPQSGPPASASGVAVATPQP